MPTLEECARRFIGPEAGEMQLLPPSVAEAGHPAEFGLALAIMELGRLEGELLGVPQSSPTFHATANAYRVAAVRLIGLARRWQVPLEMTVHA